jgi:hypothetical protein
MVIPIKPTAYDPNNDLRRRFIHPVPRQQAGIKFSASDAAGCIELAWLRGQQTGIHDAYLAIRREHPEAADFLLERFRMSKDGNYRLNVSEPLAS